MTGLRANEAHEFDAAISRRVANHTRMPRDFRAIHNQDRWVTYLQGSAFRQPSVSQLSKE